MTNLVKAGFSGVLFFYNITYSDMVGLHQVWIELKLANLARFCDYITTVVLTVIINVCLLKVLAYIELPKQSATHICLCVAQLSPPLPRPCSALPSTNVPQLLCDASVFLIGGTDKDKWATSPPAGVCVLS